MVVPNHQDARLLTRVPGVEDTVTIACVSGGGWEADYGSAREALIDHDHVGAQRIIRRLNMTSGPGIAQSRSQMMVAWLADPKPSKWLLFVDDDMVFEEDALERLLATALEADAGIAGGLCFAAGPPPKPTIFTVTPDGSMERHWDFPRDGWLDIDATGGAFMLIRRDVVVAMANAHTKDGKLTTPHPWFADGVTRSGESMSEDVAFCVRARSLGYRVVVDPRIEIGHIKKWIIDLAGYDLFRDFAAENAGVPFSCDVNEFYKQAAERRGLRAPSAVRSVDSYRQAG